MKMELVKLIPIQICTNTKYTNLYSAQQMYSSKQEGSPQEQGQKESKQKAPLPSTKVPLYPEYGAHAMDYTYSQLKSCLTHIWSLPGILLHQNQD